MTTLSDYLRSHPSKKETQVKEGPDGKLEKFEVEEYRLFYDRKHDRKFIGQQGSMKREEIE